MLLGEQPLLADTHHQTGFSFYSTIYFAVHTRVQHLSCQSQLDSIPPSGHRCGLIRKATYPCAPSDPHQKNE